MFVFKGESSKESGRKGVCTGDVFTMTMDGKKCIFKIVKTRRGKQTAVLQPIRSRRFKRSDNRKINERSSRNLREIEDTSRSTIRASRVTLQIHVYILSD